MISTSSRHPRYREPDPKYMTFVGHLDELRRRLIVSISAIAAGSAAGWFLSPALIHQIDAPLRASLHGHGRLVATTVYGGFTLQLKVAIIVGFAFALPVTLYQLWGFLAPAFGAVTNRYAPIFIGSGLGLFTGGRDARKLTRPNQASSKPYEARTSPDQRLAQALGFQFSPQELVRAIGRSKRIHRTTALSSACQPAARDGRRC